jgi:pyridoxamine 5'-phosphate oxidase
VHDLRPDFSREELDREHLDDDPVRQFERWFEDAGRAGIAQPNAVSLATASADGRPLVRTVLLKLFDRRGFVFFTNYGSRKAVHIAKNPHASMLFPWITIGRQVIVSGAVERLSAAESLRYFATRPRGSQMGAWASAQSSVISSRALLEGKLAEIRRKFESGEIPVPSFWGGFRIVPATIEFWQSRENRMHDRFLYTREGEDWRIDRLEP